MSNIKNYTDLHRLVHGLGDFIEEEHSDAVKVVAAGACGMACLGITIATLLEDGNLVDKESEVLDIVSGLAHPMADAIEKMHGLGFNLDQDEIDMLPSDVVAGLRQIPVYVAAEKLRGSDQYTE